MQIKEAFILPSGEVTFSFDIANQKKFRKWDFTGHYKDNHLPPERIYVLVDGDDRIFALGNPLPLRVMP